MNKLLFVVIIVFQLFSLMSAEVTNSNKKILSLLPTTKDLPQWKPVGETEHVVGDELFELINGGAEIYHEYGFKQAVALGFKNMNQKSFNLEIYEMENPAASYGVYTFKTSHQGKIIPVGSDGILEEYYLNFWKGNFVVTVIGFDSEKETMAAILLTAQKVAQKITHQQDRPDLITLLPKEFSGKLITNGIKYLRGNLALFNQYEFDSANIFGIKEGVWANYQEFKLLILGYDTKAEAQKWFENAAQAFQNNKRFKNLFSGKMTITATDVKNQKLHVETFKNYIFVVVSGNDTNQSVLNTIRKNM